MPMFDSLAGVIVGAGVMAAVASLDREDGDDAVERFLADRLAALREEYETTQMGMLSSADEGKDAGLEAVLMMFVQTN